MGKLQDPTIDDQNKLKGKQLEYRIQLVGKDKFGQRQ